MSSLIFTQSASKDLCRLANFLADNGAIQQAKDLGNWLLDKIDLLATSPRMGHIYQFLPLDFDLPTTDEARELTILYGKSAYKVLYFYQTLTDTVVVASVKHSKEQTYPLFS